MDWHDLLHRAWLRNPGAMGRANAPARGSKSVLDQVPRGGETRVTMLRWVFHLLLLLAVFHHGAALPGTWQAGVASDQAAQHAVLHWQGQQHHHHDDGGVHKHSGADSAQHLQADNLLQSPALMSDPAGAAGTDAPPIPPAPRADVHPKTAFVALPERPPRSLR